MPARAPRHSPRKTNENFSYPSSRTLACAVTFNRTADRWKQNIARPRRVQWDRFALEPFLDALLRNHTGWISSLISERITSRNLHQPRVESVGDPAKGRRSDAPTGSAGGIHKVRVIEEVERLPPKLEILAFRYPCPLGNVQIGIDHP